MHGYQTITAMLAISCGVSLGGDWQHWRGPAHNGSSEEKNLPTSWGATKNVAWTTALPGPGAATPIISGGRIWISSAARSGNALLGMCIDRKDGKIIWQRRLGTDRRISRNNMASPSPVTDGKRAYFLYGTGDLAALDLQGKVIWSRQLEKDYGKFFVKFGYSTSPLLHAGRLYVSVVRRNAPHRAPSGKTARLDSFLLAIDPANGKTIWKHQRATDAIDESQDSYSSPIPCEIGGSDGILMAGADYVTCHDAKSGKELWRRRYVSRKHRQHRLVPSPVVAGQLVYAAVPRGGGVFSVNPLKKDETRRPAIAWNIDKGPDVCTPLYYKGLLYVLDGRRKAMTCLEPATGKQIWHKELGGNTVFRASPTGADDKIYCINMRGGVTVLAAGRKPNVLAGFSMAERDVMASIAAADGALFIRSATKLYCIEKKQEQKP